MTEVPACSKVKMVETIGGIKITTLWSNLMIAVVDVTTSRRNNGLGVDIVRRQK